jgi:hypothetical protein
MADAAYYRQQAERAQRLIGALTDPTTRDRLSALVAEYLAKAQALEAASASNPTKSM